MRGLLGLVLIFALILTAQAQDDSAYRLRYPTAEAVLQTVVDEAPDLQSELTSPFFANSFSTISEVVLYRYPDFSQTPFRSLLQAYDALDLGRTDVIQRGEWVRRMVAAWILERGIDLAATTKITFEDFHITVIPRDFNSDGVNEYLLDMTKGEPVDRERCVEQAEVVDYLVAQETPTGYRFIETGLPWKGNAPSGRYSYGDGGIVEERFEDLNGDGLPEWVVLISGETAGGPGMGYVDYGQLFVLGWQQDGLVDLVPEYDPVSGNHADTTLFGAPEADCSETGPYPLTVSWEFLKPDSATPARILQSQRFEDNWKCQRTETRTFEWDAATQRYHYVETGIVYAEATQNCVQRNAEEIMWTGDYAAAIPIFERALTLETLDVNLDESFNYPRSLNQYLRARLALAYLMTGQGDRADPLLEALTNETIQDVAIDRLVDALSTSRENNLSPLEICVAAYGRFTFESYPATDRIPQIRVGYTGDDLFYNGNNPYQPENIGCDAPGLLRSTLDAKPIEIGLSPVTYLQNLGLAVQRSLETDLNDDGVSEWLIWPNIAGVEIFFVPHDTNYDTFFTNLDPYAQATDMDELDLPNSSSALAFVRPSLVPFQPWRGTYSILADSLQGPTACSLQNDAQSFIYAVSLLRWQGRDFVPLFQEWQCGTTLKGIFSPSADALTLMQVECLDGYCTESITQPETYRWDAGRGTYVAPTPFESTAQPTSAPQPTPTPQPYPQYHSPYSAFVQRDFAAIVGMTSAGLMMNPDDNLDDQLGNYYLRALALEALGQPDDALAMYVAITQTAPASFWGSLAALHFESVEAESN